MWQEITTGIIGLLAVGYTARKIYRLLISSKPTSPCAGCPGCTLTEKSGQPPSSSVKNPAPAQNCRPEIASAEHTA